MGPVGYGYKTQNIVILLSLGFLFHVSSINPQSQHVLDLLHFLNTSGLTYIPGQNNKTSALLLEDSSRNIAMPDSVLDKTLQMFKDNSEITFLATVRQEIGDIGSIIAFSSDVIRFLEIESSGRKDEIRFHYTHDQQIRVETFPYRLADNKWHKLAISLSGTHLTLFVDCNKIYERVIQTVDRMSKAGNIKLYVGQRNGQHALFRGALQDVQIVTQAHGYLLQCPLQDSDCPTCAQYQTLEQYVKHMYSLYQNLSLKLLQAEERIASLEQCECLKSCSHNGTTHKEGEVWYPDQCTVCMCRNGTVDCKKVDCPLSECDHPVYRDGVCCPVCLTNCYYSGKYFDHGESYSPRICVTCTCTDGSMNCKGLDPEENCPHLNCPAEERLHIDGECCPVCKGTDFCGMGNDCHENATCINRATLYTCQCKMGFQGNGKTCTDVDECLTKGGKFGHHCNGNTKCVNTVGSYMCQCASGHTPSDPYSCEGTDSISKSNSNHNTIHKSETVIALCLCLIAMYQKLIVAS